MDLPEEVEAELAKFKSSLRKMYKRQGKAAVFFERNYRTSHLQIQAVPVPKDMAADVKKVYLDSAATLELDLNEIPPHVPLSQLAVQVDLWSENLSGFHFVFLQGQAYFYAETPDKQKLFGRITGIFFKHILTH